MLKSGLICALLCACLLEINAQSEVQKVRNSILKYRVLNYTSKAFLPTTVAFQNNLVTISEDGPSINLTTYDSSVNCKLNLTLNNVSKFIALRDAVVLPSDKIVYYGLNSISFKYDDKEDPIEKNFTHQFLIIDPKTCTYEKASVESSINASLRILAPVVIPYNGNFLFVEGNLNGEHNPIKVTEQGLLDQLVPEFSAVEKPVTEKIHLHKYGDDRGYFFAQNFKNGTAVMQRLAHNFVVMSEKFVNHTVDVVSVRQEANGFKLLTAICYTKWNETTLEKPAPTTTPAPVTTPAPTTTPAADSTDNSTVIPDTTSTTTSTTTKAPESEKKDKEEKEKLVPTKYHVCEAFKPDELDVEYNVTFPHDQYFEQNPNVFVDKNNDLYVTVSMNDRSYNYTDIHRYENVHLHHIAKGKIEHSLYVGNFTERHFDVNVNYLPQEDSYCISVTGQSKIENTIYYSRELNVHNFCIGLDEIRS